MLKPATAGERITNTLATGEHAGTIKSQLLSELLSIFSAQSFLLLAGILFRGLTNLLMVSKQVADQSSHPESCVWLDLGSKRTVLKVSNRG